MRDGPSSQEIADGGELLLPLTDLSHQFNSPDIEPLTPNRPEVVGISGVEYLLNLFHMDKKLQRARTLVIELPATHVAAAEADSTAQALRRYTASRIARARRELRSTYLYGWRITGLALLLLAVCLSLSSL